MRKTKNTPFRMNVLTIDHVDRVSFNGEKYVYNDGKKEHILEPTNMIIRSNLEAMGPVVYVSWNDDAVQANWRSKFVHPTRNWYAKNFNIPYMDAREITVERWFILDYNRRTFSDIR